MSEEPQRACTRLKGCLTACSIRMQQHRTAVIKQLVLLNVEDVLEEHAPRTPLAM